MRNVTLFCLAGFTLFLSCETYQVYQGTTAQHPLRTTDLVMPPHERPIEIFYLKESLSKKPITELALIHINVGGYGTEEQLLEQAKIQARSVGADGVYVLNREEYMRYNVLGDFYDTPEVDRTELRAVAFVYDENLKDSVRVYEARLLAEQERLKPQYFVKSNNVAKVNLYRSPEVQPKNIAVVVSDAEPMEFLERTNIELYNQKRTLKSYLFKVRYRNEELYVSGFDVIRKL